MPKISIIIPVYNCEKYLDKCINSVLNQSFADFELILVDDGSSDHSGKICDKFAKWDKRVFAIHKENGGAAFARNCGLKIAQGELIGFVDSDDYIHPQMYEILLEVMKRTGADISACHYKFVQPEREERYLKYNEEIYTTVKTVSCEDILQHFDEHCRKVSLISPCMRLCKRKLFENLRFKEGYIEEDSMLLMPLLAVANKISKVYVPLYFWNENPQSVTRKKFNYKRFSFVQVSYERIIFFDKREDKRLVQLFQREFMNRCIAFYLKAQETGTLKEFSRYTKLYRRKFFSYISHSGFCKLEIMMHILFFLHIPLYKNFYEKLQPVDSIYLK